MAASSSVPLKETVYSGPAVETVYGGGGTSAAPKAGNTVYDPSNHRPRTMNNGAVRDAVKSKVQRASLRFFIVAGLSLIEFFVFRETQPTTAIGALLIAVIFGVIGIFAMRLSRGAFIAGMLLYGLDTLLWLLNGVNGNMAAVAWPVFIHCVILYRLWSGYKLIGQLDEA